MKVHLCTLTPALIKKNYDIANANLQFCVLGSIIRSLNKERVMGTQMVSFLAYLLFLHRKKFRNRNLCIFGISLSPRV